MRLLVSLVSQGSTLGPLFCCL